MGGALRRAEEGEQPSVRWRSDLGRMPDRTQRNEPASCRDRISTTCPILASAWQWARAFSAFFGSFFRESTEARVEKLSGLATRSKAGETRFQIRGPNTR